jgi:predicted RNase H-like HicB family nuclease
MGANRYIVPVEIEELEEGGYLAICPTIPGCHAEGESIGEAIEFLEDVARVVLEFRQEEGLGIPEDLGEAAHGPVEVKAQIVVTVA